MKNQEFGFVNTGIDSSKILKHYKLLITEWENGHQKLSDWGKECAPNKELVYVSLPVKKFRAAGSWVKEFPVKVFLKKNVRIKDISNE